MGFKKDFSIDSPSSSCLINPYFSKIGNIPSKGLATIIFLILFDNANSLILFINNLLIPLNTLF